MRVRAQALAAPAAPALAAPAAPALAAPAALVLLLCCWPAWGASPVDVHEFPDVRTEARFRALIAEFRCPKCLNTNLAGSDAPIAQDLRAAVHRLVVREGFSDAQVRDYLQARYGDFVLYDPPLKAATLLLWGGPLLFVLAGLGLIAWRLRHQRSAQLSNADQARLAKILDEA
ncbi:MAG: cytochrome c-type biogenesis protein CcmH [Gammaproteobacteria bacterium]|nr:cytochrome c-type biogenesis protein CcmH [Gammaproteobacteria bacterium]